MKKLGRALAVLAGLSLVACSSTSPGDDATENGAEAGSRDVAIGVLPVLPTGALFLGEEQGFFADHGIELSIETSQGGAAVIPAVVSGQIQFGTSNVISLLQAREQGLDLRVIAHWTSSVTSGEGDATAVASMPDSGVENPADLAGRTVAVNTLNNIGELAVREAVSLDGGDPDAIQFVEMGFPDMPAALTAGNIDAAWTPEPFITILLDAGAQIVSEPNNEAVLGMPSQMVFTTGELVESDPDLVADMTAAINLTLEYAEENPDEVRDAAGNVLDMDPDLLARVRLEEFGTDLRREQIERVAELMLVHGLVSEAPDVDALFAN